MLEHKDDTMHDVVTRLAKLYDLHGDSNRFDDPNSHAQNDTHAISTRQHMEWLGKRTDFSARTVLSGDPTLHINETLTHLSLCLNK
jgi:hypothetical protein